MEIITVPRDQGKDTSPYLEGTITDIPLQVTKKTFIIDTNDNIQMNFKDPHRKNLKEPHQTNFITNDSLLTKCAEIDHPLIIGMTVSLRWSTDTNVNPQANSLPKENSLRNSDTNDNSPPNTVTNDKVREKTATRETDMIPVEDGDGLKNDRMTTGFLA